MANNPQFTVLRRVTPTWDFPGRKAFLNSRVSIPKQCQNREGSKVEKTVLEIVMQLGSIWLSANVALVTYLALMYMFDRVMERMDMRRRVPAVRRSHNLQIVGR